MESRTCHSSGDSSNSSANGGGDQCLHLRHLNKISHKISKPVRRTTNAFDSQAAAHAPPPPLPQTEAPPSNLQQQQQQPPVYNINKNDFREVVQKLTGSPAHDRFPPAPPPIIQPPKPQSSRLQRIRPPPLSQISNRPTPMLNCAPPNPSHNPVNAGGYQRPAAPMSPLPPLPAVHGAAESPISAYMRYLQAADSDPRRFPMNSPKWNNLVQAQSPPFPPPQDAPPSTTSAFPPPPSPLPFGCLPSPLFSPSSLPGFSAFPVSPTLPVPSPRWKDH